MEMPTSHINDGSQHQQELSEHQATLAVVNLLHQEMMGDMPTLRRLRHNAVVLGHEVVDHDHKLVALGATAITATTQTADRLRALIPVVAYVARETYDYTSNPLAAGVAGGICFSIWGMTVGEPLNHSVRMLPKTVENVGQTFPNLVRTFEDALPGMKKKGTDQLETDEREPLKATDRVKKAGKALGSYIGKGLVAIGFGTTAYTLTSVAREDTTRETTKLNLEVSRDGGVVLAGFITGLVGGTEALAENGQEDIAQWINDTVINNNIFWYGLAGTAILANFVMNHFEKKEPALYIELDEQRIKEESPLPEAPSLTVRAKIRQSTKNVWEKIKNTIPQRQKAL